MLRCALVALTEDEWLYGWDDTPGIVSVWAEADGRALVWRRPPGAGQLVREEATFRPWLLAPSLVDLRHLGARLVPHADAARAGGFSYEELEGSTGLRYMVSGGRSPAAIGALRGRRSAWADRARARARTGCVAPASAGGAIPG